MDCFAAALLTLSHLIGQFLIGHRGDTHVVLVVVSASSVMFMSAVFT